jgi:hypothetical protein
LTVEQDPSRPTRKQYPQDYRSVHVGAQVAYRLPQLPMLFAEWAAGD